MTKQEAMEKLQALIGKPSPHTEWFTVTQDRIDVFSVATKDPQWIHTDVERAKTESPYGTTIAHGFLTLSLINPLTNPSSPITAFREAAKFTVNYGLNKVRFPAPVPAGARVRGHSTLLTVEDKGDCIQYTREAVVEVEGGGKPCLVAETVHRLYF